MKKIDLRKLIKEEIIKIFEETTFQEDEAKFTKQLLNTKIPGYEWAMDSMYGSGVKIPSLYKSGDRTKPPVTFLYYGDDKGPNWILSSKAKQLTKDRLPDIKSALKVALTFMKGNGLKENTDTVNKWKKLTPDQRELLLLAVDDDKGPEYADKYMDQADWTKIPTDIANMIDLKEGNKLKENTSNVKIEDNKKKISQLLKNKSIADNCTLLTKGSYNNIVVLAYDNKNVHNRTDAITRYFKKKYGSEPAGSDYEFVEYDNGNENTFQA
jgi:hypothetical protein